MLMMKYQTANYVTDKLRFVYKGMCMRTYICTYTHSYFVCFLMSQSWFNNQMNTKIYMCNKGADAFRGQHTSVTHGECLSCGWFVL